MTKRHFIALADTIRAYKQMRVHFQCVSPPFDDDQIGVLADFCQTQNPRFNRQLWLDYVNGKCGPSGGKVKV